MLSGLVAVSLAVGMTVAGAGDRASADQPRQVISQGITAAGGLLVDPAGRVWVSDTQQGFCRVTEASGNPAGQIEKPTCLGGPSGAPQKGARKPGAPALVDPTPESAGSGDEIALIPDSAASSAYVTRARWDAPSKTFRYANTLTLFGGDLRPVAVSVGPDRNAYVVFERARSVVRIMAPTTVQPEIETVAFLSANGARAVAVGAADSSGRVTVYAAEATRLVSFVAPVSGSSGAAASASYAVGAVARLYYDSPTRVLYAGTAAATAAGGDRIIRVLTANGQIESNWAVGFTRVGGISVRGNLVLATDDPGLVTSPVQTGKGAVYTLGEIVPRIVAGPTSADGSQAPDPTITNDSTPTFTIAVDGAVSLQCAFDGAAFTACAAGDVTPSTPLADGPHRFAVRAGSTGTPVQRDFSVDTTPPPAPTIVTPAQGSTVGASFALNITAESGATLRCAIDDNTQSPGSTCTSGQTMSLTAGAHSLRVTATDRVGNVSSPRTSSFTVDRTAPTPLITAPAADGQTLTGTATFAFSAGADPGLTYRCRIDTQPYEACTSPRSYTALTSGNHTFTVEARNALGNTATAARSFVFAVPDTTAPVVTASPAGGTYDSGQQITLTANEPATIRFTVDGSTPTASSPQYSTPIVLSTDLTLRYFAIDSAGNASAPVTQTYLLRRQPPAQPHDYDGDQRADVVSIDAGGALWLYRGDGSGGWLGSRVVATGWGSVDAIITPGDWNGDGRPDIIARVSGELRLFKGDGAGGFSGPTTIATGFGGLSLPFSPGDWDGDGRSDILARDGSGRLMLYPGDGKGGLQTAREVGTGWNIMTAIIGPGDWNGDGRPDVLARNTSGDLLLYPGNGTGGWLSPRQVGSGWNIMTAIIGPGDWNGDGRPDVLARNTSGDLYLYPGNGTGGWLSARLVGTGWNSMRVIA